MAPLVVASKTIDQPSHTADDDNRESSETVYHSQQFQKFPDSSSSLDNSEKCAIAKSREYPASGQTTFRTLAGMMAML